MGENSNKYKKRYQSVPISHLLKYSKSSAPTTLKKLNDELLDTYNKICLPQSEVELRQKVFGKFKELIEKNIDSTVESFGSFRTNVMVYDSDIDITVIINQTQSRSDPKDIVNHYLSQIHQIVHDSDLVSGPIIHLKRARTPILKFTDKSHGYKIDVSINKVDGIHTADYIIEQLKICPDMKYFMIILKYYLKCRKLSDTANGGLCAYAQFLMILSFFQQHPLLQNNNLSVKENLAVLFMDFFQFYGLDFPYERTTIQVSENRYIPNREGHISIEDPISPGNNVAGGCTSIGLIKDLFAYSYKIMVAAIAQEVDPKKSIVELWMRLHKSRISEQPKRFIKK